MNTIELKEKKEKQLYEQELVVESWRSKLKFSVISLLFFTIISVIYGLNPFIGVIPTIIFITLGVIFIQQTIRSYNYLRFSETNYNATVLIHKMVDDINNKKGE
jgi:hypothetical protein